MIFSLKRKTIFGIAFFGILTFLLFFISETANAWVFDLGMKQLDALDFVDEKILPLIFRLLKWLIFSQVFLIISAELLHWAINLPIYLGNDLVQTGWSFILRITNLFFILMLVFIALCHILKIEIGKSFSTMKAFVRLIIIALFVNFSLVLVGMLADVAQVALFAIRDMLIGDGHLIWQAIEPLKDNIGRLALTFSITLNAYLVTALIPYSSVATAAFLFGVAISEALTGGYTIAILLTIFGFIMGIIFLIYAVFFLARVIIIWLLAIVAPLALASWIFPFSETFAREWFKALLEWLFIGIAGIFVLGLGLGFFAHLSQFIEMGDPIHLGGVEIFPTFSFIYLFLITYLIISFVFIKKCLVPKAMAQQIAKAEKMVKGAAKAAGGYGALAGQGWDKTGGKAWKAVGGSGIMERGGEKLQKRGEANMDKETTGTGRWDRAKGVTIRGLGRLQYRAGEHLKEAGSSSAKTGQEATERLDKAKKGMKLKQDFKPKPGETPEQTAERLTEELAGRGEGEAPTLSEQTATRTTETKIADRMTEKFSGYNQEERIAGIHHLAEKGELNPFLNNPDNKKIVQETINQAKGTPYVKQLQQVAPDKAVEWFGKPSGATVKDATRTIGISNAHKIGIEALKNPKVTRSLSVEQLHNIHKEGTKEQAMAIAKAIPQTGRTIGGKKSALQVAQRKAGDINSTKEVRDKAKIQAEKLQKEVNRLEKDHIKQKKYMNNSPYWQMIEKERKKERKRERAEAEAKK